MKLLRYTPLSPCEQFVNDTGVKEPQPATGGHGFSQAHSLVVVTTATFMQRMFTSYLPPTWGWFVPALMPKGEHL
jgi:hypothetical protein